MAVPPEDAEAKAAQPATPAADEPAELLDELHRVLVDHELDRGTTRRTVVSRRRRRVLREAPGSMMSAATKGDPPGQR